MFTLERRMLNFLALASFISDKQQQLVMWTDPIANDGFIISLEELYCQFFDDNAIDNFISDDLESSPLSLPQKNAVRNLKDALEAFDKLPVANQGPANDFKLLDDPDWNEVGKVAQTAMLAFKDWPNAVT